MKNNSVEAVKVFNQKALEYASKFKDLEKYHDGFDLLTSQLTISASVLDMACGPGNITNYLLESRPDLKILGIDLAPNMITVATANNDSAEFKILDIRDVNTLNCRFEAIVVGFGLPYLSKVEAQTLINDISVILNKDGIVYISTMEGNYVDSGLQKSSDGKNEMFIYYHEATYVKEFIIQAGLNIIWEKHQPYYEDEALRFTDYIVIAKKIS